MHLNPVPGICYLGFTCTTALRSSTFPADKETLSIDKYHTAEAFLITIYLN